MNKVFMTLAAAGCFAVAMPAMVAPAQAEIVRKSVTVKKGPLGHGCRTVRTVGVGPLGGKNVRVRRTCG